MVSNAKKLIGKLLMYGVFFSMKNLTQGYEELEDKLSGTGRTQTNQPKKKTCQLSCEQLDEHIQGNKMSVASTSKSFNGMTFCPTFLFSYLLST